MMIFRIKALPAGVNRPSGSNGVNHWQSMPGDAMLTLSSLALQRLKPHFSSDQITQISNITHTACLNLTRGPVSGYLFRKQTCRQSGRIPGNDQWQNLCVTGRRPGNRCPARGGKREGLPESTKLRQSTGSGLSNSG